jgi:hypothetical protein
MKNDVLRPGRPQHRMVDGNSGRTDRPDLWRLGIEARPRTEADDREVRQPRALLRLVHAEPFEAPVEIGCEPPGRPALVVEEEHADASRLAVPADLEGDAVCGGGGLLQRGADRVDLTCRAVAEEGKGEVQVLARDGTELSARQAVLPPDEAVEDCVGQLERAEQTDAGIAPDASR